MLTQFLAAHDVERVERGWGRLLGHDVRAWALTGGIAVEVQLQRFGCLPVVRPLNDIDFVAAAFDDIPQSLADEFLFRHIHPAAAPGQTMLQVIDPESALRFDVFRASAGTMARTSVIDSATGGIRIVSLEDLIARSARLVLQLSEGVPVARKHAREFLRLMDFASSANMETAWPDHRKPSQPVQFSEAAALLLRLIPASHELLIDPEYSKNVTEQCQRCRPTGRFRPVEAKVILSILGYC
jgi:hypothetical protein